MDSCQWGIVGARVGRGLQMLKKGNFVRGGIFTVFEEV